MFADKQDFCLKYELPWREAKISLIKVSHTPWCVQASFFILFATLEVLAWNY
jgi:hypothetical protein